MDVAPGQFGIPQSSLAISGIYEFVASQNRHWDVTGALLGEVLAPLGRVGRRETDVGIQIRRRDWPLRLQPSENDRYALLSVVHLGSGQARNLRSKQR